MLFLIKRHLKRYTGNDNYYPDYKGDSNLVGVKNFSPYNGQYTPSAPFIKISK